MRGGFVATPQGDVAARLLLGHGEPTQCHRPQVLDLVAEFHEGGDVVAAGATSELLAPVLDVFDALRHQRLGLLGVGARPPAGGGHEEVRDAAVGLRRVHCVVVQSGGQVGERNISRRGGQPGLRGELVTGIHGVACPNEGVSAAQVQAEPGGVEAAGHGVEPQGDFGELHRGRVKVDLINVV